jgi:hypothetical protein
LDIICKDDVTNLSPKLVSQSVATDTCNPKITIENDAGCLGKTFNAIWGYISKSIYGIAMTMVILGAVIGFYGSTF